MTDTTLPHPSSEPGSELRGAALALMRLTGAAQKAAGAAELGRAWAAGGMRLDTSAEMAEPPGLPGRPDRPALVAPRLVKRRSMVTPEGRAAMIHALAHIEFNAINLALDAVWRYAGMPADFYADWLSVAVEEAYHYGLLNDHLATLGHAYGDFDAHDSLWDMAQKTRGDVLARMALVPRTMEARGLDASPLMRAKLAQAGDQAAAGILDIVLRDEIGHVAIGNRWFGWLCSQRGADPVEVYAELALLHKAPVLKGPFNLEARRAAGFSEAELARLGS